MIDRDIKNTIDTILDVIRYKYIPTSYQAQYYTCDVALQDFVSPELCEYYGELQKLKLANHGITAALILLPNNKNIKPLDSRTGNYLDMLDDNEFADSGYNKPVQTVEGKYIYYSIQTGDTLQRIAQKAYGDYRLYTYIEEENNIRASDLIDKDLTGVVIRIPVMAENTNRDSYNLVYEPFTSEPKVKMLGRDIYLQNGKIQVDTKGDIRAVEAEQCVVQNIEDRLNHLRGSLNPIHQDWGVESVASYNLPYSAAIKKFTTSVREQIESDPRVQSVSLAKDAIVSGDAVYISLRISLGSGSEETVVARIQ